MHLQCVFRKVSSCGGCAGWLRYADSGPRSVRSSDAIDSVGLGGWVFSFIIVIVDRGWGWGCEGMGEYVGR